MTDTAFSMVHDGLTRTGIVYLPADYDAMADYPLLVLLHGGAGDGLKVLDQTGFRAAADAHKIIVAAPDGVAHNWNDGRGTTDAELQGVDDVGFMRALVAQMIYDYPVMLGRSYAAGVSNGGIMCFRLACEAADVFAAVCPVVASIAADVNGAPAEPIGIMCIQGTADPFIPIDGGDTHHKTFSNLGDGGIVDSAKATRTRFAGANGCKRIAQVTKPAPTVNDGTKVTTYKHLDCASGVAVEYHIVDGMGHCWPPYPPEKVLLSGKTSGNLDATALICDFIARH
jgi:polyhydroxybutyrate depolymerase